MRLLAYSAFFFSAYIFLCAYFEACIISPVVWALILAAALIVIITKVARLKAVAFALVGVCLAGMWSFAFEHLVRKPAVCLIDSEITIEAVATDFSANTVYEGTRVEAKLVSPVKAKVILWLEDETSIEPGDRITTKVYIEPSGNDEFERYYSSKGIFISASQTDAVRIDISGRNVIKYLPKHIAHKIKLTLPSLFANEEEAVMRALLTADKSALNENEALTYSLQRSGLSHLVAVSGMHVSFLLAVVSLLIRSRRAANIVSVPLMLLFAAITGFSPGVVRASVMRLFIMGAWESERHSDSLTSLAAALAVLLAFNPYSAASVSLQLSFASTLGLVLFSGRINKAIRPKFPRGKSKWRQIPWRAGVFAASVISASVSSWVFTAPLCAFYFDIISVVSPVSNLLSLWSVPGAFILGAVGTALGAIWTPLGVPFAFVAGLCIKYFSFIATLTGGAAFSAVHISAWPVKVWLVCAYVAIGAACAVKSRKRAVPLSALAVAAMLALCLLYINLRPLPLTMNVIDVGQGSCTLFASRKTAVMVDCGGENAGERALAQMRNRGLESLDVLIFTHLHSDHSSGAQILLSQIEVDCVIVPDNDLEELLKLEEYISKDTKLIKATSDMTIQTAELELEIMVPRSAKKDNDESLSVLCSSGSFNALITGDLSDAGERQLCARYELPRCDVYVAGHHGAADSSGETLLDTIRPASAVISAGSYNPYGHPDVETVQRLKLHGAQVKRTDIDGNISLPMERRTEHGEKN